MEQRLAASEERNRVMRDTMPLSCVFWDENGNLVDCNPETLSLFGLAAKEEFLTQFLSGTQFSVSSKHSPDRHPAAETVGSDTLQQLQDAVRNAFLTGRAEHTWTHRTACGKSLFLEMTLIRIPKGGGYVLAGYIRDLRRQDAALQYVNAKNGWLYSVSGLTQTSASTRERSKELPRKRTL